jgi:hypothetical protein
VPVPPTPSRPPGPPGAEPEGVGGTPGDPLFQKREPAEATPRRVVLLWQFFFFPLLIVACAVGVFLFFGLIGGSERPPLELLDRVRKGGENVKQQAGQQLALQIAEERNRVDAGAREPSAAFYADPRFREGLREAFRLAQEDGADDRQKWLALALGRSQDVGVLYPPPGRAAAAAGMRAAAAVGVYYLDSPVALPVLGRMAGDEHPEIRAVTHLALARLAGAEGPDSGSARGDPRVAGTLRRGLSDADGGVRLNAAVGLAVLGDDAGAGELGRAMDRSELSRFGIVDSALQSAALLNAIRAAKTLGTPDLKARVERLTDRAVEPDDLVRHRARQAIDQWRTP